MNKTLMSLSLLSVAIFGSSQQANAHGYVESPASRSYQCRLQLNTQCGSVHTSAIYPPIVEVHM